MAGSNDQFKIKTEQAYSAEAAAKAGSEYISRNSIRLNRSTLSFSAKSSRPMGLSQAAVRLF
jgi:predicted SprT family Zn-dependent metalloprotease